MSEVLLKEFRPGLWLSELSLADFDVRGAVIVGERSALVWDTLSRPADMAPVKALLGDASCMVAYSHADWDHVWGTAGLPDCVTIVAHDLCRVRFDTDVPAKLDAMRSQEPGQWEDVRLIPPAVTFATAMTVDLGGVVVELHHLPGHTEDCLIAFVPQWGIFLAGDTVETPFPVVGEAAAIPGWLNSLERWAGDERIETVIPCHGDIGGRDIIQANIDYLGSLTREAPSAVSDTLSPFYVMTHRLNLKAVGRDAL